LADSLLTIRTRVAAKVGGNTNIDSQIDENINEAILQVIQEAKPQEMWEDDTFSTSSAVAEYSFSTLTITNALAILFVRNVTNDYEIKHTSYEVWNRYKQDTTSSSSLGDPHLWTRYQNGILLFGRIPDSTSRTIQWIYLKRPTRLSADADTFPLNDEWKRPVEELAAYMTLRDRNSDKAELKLAVYQQLMSQRTTPEGEEDASPEGAAFIPVSNLNLVS
jgi:hypothetical protein